MNNITLDDDEFENSIIYRFRECLAPDGIATLSRYGVTANPIPGWAQRNANQVDYGQIGSTVGIETSKVKMLLDYFGTRTPPQGVMWQPMRSKPDFEGCVRPWRGRQFIIEAKVCSEASLSLHDSKTAHQQVSHLLERAEFGAVTIIAVHFNPMPELKTKIVGSMTVAFPVHPRHPFWRQHAAGAVKRISRAVAEECGVRIEWNVYPGKRKESPDVMGALQAIADTELFSMPPATTASPIQQAEIPL